jgi:flagellin-like protein
MRGLPGLLGLVIVVAIIFALAKRQLPSSDTAVTTAPQVVQQLPKQAGLEVENALQQQRAMPDDK